MDANAARTQNMRIHVANAGGPAEWARKFGGTRWQQPQVSQWISETAPKGIGRKLARDLETAMGIEPGSLDRQVGAASHAVGLDVSTLRSAIRLLQLVAEIRRTPKIPDIDANALAVAYETVQLEDASLDDSNVVDFMRAFAERLERREKENGVERGPAAGAGTATG